MYFAAVVCSPAFAQKASASNDLLVAAAADLAPLEKPLNGAFARIAGRQLRFVLGASGLLARQIEQGAPYDVFLSADERFIQQLNLAGRLDASTVRLYAYGRLGLWCRSGQYRTLADLLAPALRHLAIANPTHAPYGAAAKALLQRERLWPKLEPKIVYGENVRQALQYAETGNADAVLTAWTLLLRRPNAVLLPDEAYPPIRQAGAVIKGSQSAADARRFLDLLASPEGRRILATAGLRAP
jgi:molybdate transport system substrate-binding protein